MNLLMVINKASLFHDIRLYHNIGFTLVILSIILFIIVLLLLMNLILKAPYHKFLVFLQIIGIGIAFVLFLTCLITSDAYLNDNSQYNFSNISTEVHIKNNLHNLRIEHHELKYTTNSNTRNYINHLIGKQTYYDTIHAKDITKPKLAKLFD